MADTPSVQLVGLNHATPAVCVVHTYAFSGVFTAELLIRPAQRLGAIGRGYCRFSNFILTSRQISPEMSATVLRVLLAPVALWPGRRDLSNVFFFLATATRFLVFFQVFPHTCTPTSPPCLLAYQTRSQEESEAMKLHRDKHGRYLGPQLAGFII